MSTEPMIFDPEDPRLTAYALGELTDPTERAQVEQLLAASPEARAELADIRSLTAALTAEYEQERADAEADALPAKVVSMTAATGRRSRLGPLLQIAAVLVVLALAVFASLPVYHSLQVRGVRQANQRPVETVMENPGEQKVAATPSSPLLALNERPTGSLRANGGLDSAVPPAPEADAPLPSPNATARLDFGPGSTKDIASQTVPEPAAPPVKHLSEASAAGRVIVAGSNVPTSEEVGAAPVDTVDQAGRNRVAQHDAAKTMQARRAAAPAELSSTLQWEMPVRRPQTDIDETTSRYFDKAKDFNTADYAHAAENGFLTAKENPLSTFSIDVDTASYSLTRRFIESGSLPPKDAVRVEEMLNYFPYADTPPAPGNDKPFAIHLEAAACPWDTEHRLVRIGIKGKEIDTDKRPASNLVFLLDVSGSMMPEERLPLIKASLHLMVEKLREDDHVAIVVYAGESGLALPSTSGDHKDTILRAIDNLHAGGSTNGASGIKLAYNVARKGFIKGGTNRVILATDGDFNVGVTSHGDLLRLIEEERKSGVFLSVLGVGTDNLKDSTMQTLADHGNGQYAYLDRLEEGRKVLVEQMSGTLVTIAKDVKIQVEFNPATVAAYRLIGYEKRMLKKEDFNDDRVDAGEIGAGHSVTALYEIVPAGQPAPGAGPGVDALRYQSVPAPAASATPTPAAPASGELLTVKMRHEAPDSDKSERSYEESLVDHGAPGAYANASPDFQFAAAVASFGLVLKDSPYKGSATLGSALELAQAGKGADPGAYRAGFIELVRQAQALQRSER